MANFQTAPPPVTATRMTVATVVATRAGDRTAEIGDWVVVRGDGNQTWIMDDTRFRAEFDPSDAAAIAYLAAN